MHTIRKQAGTSTLGMMSVALVLIFIAVTVMKLWSPYYDDLAVKTALEGVAKDDATRTMTPKDIINSIDKRLAVNQVSLKKGEIKIKKEDGIIKIDIIYERRIPMYGNVDAIISFKHSASINARSS